MKKLILFSERFNPDEYDFMPLPINIFNSEGTLLAHTGDKLNKERLTNTYIYIDQKTGRPIQGIKTRKNEKNELDFALSDEYEEESASVLEKKLDNLYFVPFLKIKMALRTNIHQLKEIFKKIIINNVIYLNSKENGKISRHIAGYLYNILDSNLYASEYIDMVSAIRTKDNYLTFSHSCSVAFYVMAIVKKLKMLKEDLLIGNNLGRWIPIKTEKYNKGSSTIQLPNQLLKYIDNQKNNIYLKYKNPVREILLEELHNITHEYAEIDKNKKYFSLLINFDTLNMHILAMAALNHDIGMQCIPNRILNKPGKLTHEEFRVIAKHPSLSVEKLKQVDVNIPEMFSYIMGHHRLSSERGYPPMRSEPAYESKIIAISNIYDAMRAPKHYGKVNSQEDTLEHLKELYEEGCFDLPLYLCAKHTFQEYNHEHVQRRVEKIEETV